MRGDVLSQRQVIVLLFSGLLGISADLLPTLAAQRAGSGGWLIPVLALPLLLLSLWTATRVFVLPSGFLKCIIYIMYMAQILAVLALVLRLNSLRMEQINEKFPAWVATVVLLAVAIWMGFGKTAAFARAGEIFYLALAVVIVGVIFLGALQVEPDNLAVNMTEIISLPGGGLAAAGIILNVYPVLALRTKIKAGRRGYRKVIIWTVAFCVVLTLVLVVVIGCLGPKLTAQWNEPFFTMVQGVGIKGAFQRTEALVMALMCLSDFVLVGSLFHAWRALAEGIRPGTWGRWSLLAAAPALVAGWLLFPGQEVREVALQILPVTGIVFGLILPLILCGSYVFHRRQK